MPPKYTKEQTIDQIKEAIKDMATFYRAYCVNHSGTTFKKNGNEYYTEIISEYMLAHYDLFDKIPKIKRGDYRIGTHNGTTPRASSSRKEERTALALFRIGRIHPLGDVIDYQIPLKSNNNDDAGKIDLMTFDRANGILRLIELKAANAKDTLLRCVLEGFTYYRTVDIDALIKSYKNELGGEVKSVRICSMFFRESAQDKEYKSFDKRLFEYNSKNDIRRDCLFFVELMKTISSKDAEVELLRIPYIDVDSAMLSQSDVNCCAIASGCSSVGQSGIGATANCDNSSNPGNANNSGNAKNSGECASSLSASACDAICGMNICTSMSMLEDMKVEILSY